MLTLHIYNIPIIQTHLLKYNLSLIMYAFNFVSGMDISDKHISNINLSKILCHINAFFIIQVIFTIIIIILNKNKTNSENL